MTREDIVESLNILKEQALKSHNDTAVLDVKVESFVWVIESAIKALSQEPCVKPTTEDAIKTIQELMIACTPDSKYYRVGQMAISAILENEELSKDLDEALREIDEYEQGKKDALSQEPCDDAISRQAVDEIKELMTDINGNTVYAVRMSDIRQLPSVAQKSGKWILLDECANSGYYCSECHKKLVKEGWSNTVKKINFCPNCGARMESDNNE